MNGIPRKEYNYQMRTDDLMVIVGLCKLMNKAIHYEPLLEQIISYCVEAMNVEDASILMYDNQIDKLIFYFATGDKIEKLKKVILARNEGIAGWVFNNNKIMVSNDISKDPIFCQRVDIATGYQTKSLLAVPLILDGNVIGVFELVNKKNGIGFTDRDVVLSEGMASQIALAIERARLINDNMAHNRLAAIGEAITSLAHHIKNILTGLEGGANLVQRGINDKKFDIIEKIWPTLDRSIHRMSTLTKDMLEISKDREPDYEKSSINQTIKEASDLFNEKAMSRNLVISVDLDMSIPDFYFDSNGVYKCILNLISNAFDACDKTEKPLIFVASRNINNKTIAVEVKDNGCGMPLDVVSKVSMSKFFSTKGSMGTGLGLHVVRKIMKEHKGRLDIKSALGEGSVFTMILPIASKIPEKDSSEEM